MYQKRQKANIDDTHFIFTTNFSGDPARDRFGSDKRRVNVVIPTVEQAMDMRAMGINVKETHPNPNYTYDEPFVPTYYVPVTVNVDSKWPPHVYWITLQGKRLLCTPETIGQLDCQECLLSGKSRREAQRSRRVHPVCRCDVCGTGP